MRPESDVALVMALVEDGLTALEISRQTGIPRSTIRDWGAGRTPQHADYSSCLKGHLAALDGAAYAYLLGMYLGDGCISNRPRGVFRLRITLDALYPDIVRRMRLSYGGRRTRQTSALAPAT